MRKYVPVVSLGLLMMVGCVQDEALKRVETEVADMKLEVFKMRQQVEELNRRSESDRGALAEGRTQDRRFQADLQETLRQLQDATRVLSNRLNDGSRRGTTAAPTLAPATPAEDATFNALMLDYNRGNNALAAENFEAFLKTNPRSPKRAEALFYLGFSYYNVGAYDKALATLDRLIKEHPTSEQFLGAKFRRAMCQLKLGFKPLAIASFKEIIANFPGTTEARNAQQELNDLQS